MTKIHIASFSLDHGFFPGRAIFLENDGTVSKITVDGIQNSYSVEDFRKIVNGSATGDILWVNKSARDSFAPALAVASMMSVAPEIHSTKSISCPHCGATIKDDGSRFCAFCGALIKFITEETGERILERTDGIRTDTTRILNSLDQIGAGEREFGTLNSRAGELCGYIIKESAGRYFLDDGRELPSGTVNNYNFSGAVTLTGEYLKSPWKNCSLCGNLYDQKYDSCPRCSREQLAIQQATLNAARRRR